MKFQTLLFFLCTVLNITSTPVCSNAEEGGIQWVRAMTPATFEQAAREKRLVILDLEAVWCHWCHVMEEKTYSRADIRKTIADRYLAIRIDQDSRPDLGNRYRDYGWPATIIFDSKGQELEKLAGFVEPDEMSKILTELAANPVPRKQERKLSYSVQSSLTAELKEELKQRYARGIDLELGGLKTSHKYVEGDTVEYALRNAANGDVAAARYAKKSLDENRKLFDPVWHGVYQYSTHGDWNHPHFEKLSSKQADTVRIYAQAFTVFRDAAYEEAVAQTTRYIDSFLTDSSGAFYTSQDADVVKGKHSDEYFTLPDAERRKQGIPVVDKNMYSSENGRLIGAFAVAYGATRDVTYRRRAERAAEWALANRSLSGGGFKHGESDSGGPYLCDSLYMGDGLLRLYAVTGDRRWLAAAEKAAEFIAANFSAPDDAVGLVTSKPGSGVFMPLPLTSENIDSVRFFSALIGYSGKEGYRKPAETAMRYLATREVATDSLTEIGIVIADEELSSPPLHITIVGPKDSEATLKLFQAALSYPTLTKRTEWWDRTEGPMPNPDVQYPELPNPAAFVCTNKRCSLPIYTPEKISETVKRLSKT